MYEPYVYDITKMRNGICLNAVYAVYALNALYMPLFTWEMFHVWLIYIWEYKNGKCYMSECSLYNYKQ